MVSNGLPSGVAIRPAVAALRIFFGLINSVLVRNRVFEIEKVPPNPHFWIFWDADPALEAPCRLVSEKYRVRGCAPVATYHKNSRFAPGRGAGWPTIYVSAQHIMNIGFCYPIR